MVYIFLDESGDLGFGKKSSKWFLFTLAITNDSRALERVVKKIWKNLSKNHGHIGELHASHEKDATRTKMLSQLAAVHDLKIMTIILNKRKVYVDLQNQKNYLYNYTANLLLDRHYNKKLTRDTEQIELIIDRKDTKKSLRENFIGYLTASMQGRRSGKFNVNLHASHENKSLQAVDFISWAIFRKYEHGDFEFYEIIKDKIIDEKLLFP